MRLREPGAYEVIPSVHETETKKPPVTADQLQQLFIYFASLWSDYDTARRERDGTKIAKIREDIYRSYAAYSNDFGSFLTSSDAPRHIDAATLQQARFELKDIGYQLPNML